MKPNMSQQPKDGSPWAFEEFGPEIDKVFSEKRF